MSNNKNNNKVDEIKNKSQNLLASLKSYSLAVLIKVKEKLSYIWGDFFSLLQSTSTKDTDKPQPQIPPEKKGLSEEDIEKIQQAIQDAAGGGGQNELMFGKKLKEQINSLIPSKKTIERAKSDLLSTIKENNSIKMSLIIISAAFLISTIMLITNALFMKNNIIYWISAYINVATYSYLLGATPSAYIIVKYNSNKDLRKIGSGNIGSTNVIRAVGYKWAGVTLLLDVAKAILAVIITKIFFATDISSIEYFAGIIAFIGHIYPFWLNFQGGKGVASAFGVIAFLKPIVGLIGLLAWLLSISITRISSLSSLIGALFTLGAAYSFSNDDRGYFIMCLMMVAIVIFKHKNNIQSLYKGEEKPVESAENSAENKD